MADALHALDSKHKASLERFVEKNDWIQSKIRQLETSPLPAVDADESVLDEAALLELVDEHNRIEADVQELDNGELRALRLLARGVCDVYLFTCVNSQLY